MRFPGLLGLRRGKTEHFLRVIERGLSHMNAAEHAGNLFDAAFAVELRERADSLTVDRLFLDMQVMDGAAGNLRLMSHTEHLAVMPSCCRRRPTTSATAPPMPASISSKIIVSTGVAGR